MKQQNVIYIAIALIIAGLAFFGGIKYQESKRSNLQMSNAQNGRQFQGRFSNNQGRNSIAGRPILGEIISADDKSVTIKLEDGSSKIVILSSSTSINKASEGTISDLKTGEKISAFGMENADGSVTAQSIQLNPLMRRLMNGTPSPTKE